MTYTKLYLLFPNDHFQAIYSALRLFILTGIFPLLPREISATQKRPINIIYRFLRVPGMDKVAAGLHKLYKQPGRPCCVMLL